jgi:hypothetical protein
MKKTTTEIVDEVLSNIYANGRGMRNAKSDEMFATSGSVCVYFCDKTQAMCAVGQCMINPKEAEEEAIGSISDYFWRTADDLEVDTEELIGEGHSFTYLDERLRPEFRGHDWYFWSELQNLHDIHSHWETDNSEGKKVKLTKKGQEKLEELKSKWCTNA